EGRLLEAGSNPKDRARWVGTPGGTNFYPLKMTRDELKEGQEKLYKRLYATEAFGARLMGNLTRFRDVRIRPGPVRWRNVVVLARLASHYWLKGRSAHAFFWRSLWKAFDKSPPFVAQMVTYMGMYMHFCAVHGKRLGWDPWKSARRQPKPQPAS